MACYIDLSLPYLIKISFINVLNNKMACIVYYLETFSVLQFMLSQKPFAFIYPTYWEYANVSDDSSKKHENDLSIQCSKHLKSK